MLVHRAALGCGVILAAALAACGSNNTHATGGTTGTGGDTGTTTGPTTGGTGGEAATTSGSTTAGSGTGGSLTSVPPPPQVVSLGGTVLTAPKVQLIAYAEDPTAADADAFITELTKTTTWAEQTAEYGVGPLTVLPTIQIPGTPPATLDDDGQPSPFEQTLAANLTGANPAWGAADPNTIYMFLLPKGTNITSGGSCCSDFLGYHYEAPVGSTNVAYGISCNCGTVQGDPTTPLEWVTTTISHELVESATDPFVNDNPAFAQNDDNDAIWTVATGGELADMCEYNADENVLPAGSKYEVQRSWSNAAAKAGKNPCVPAPAAPYFNSFPLFTESVTLEYGGPWKTKGITIPVGQSKTIDVQLWSDAPTSGPWKVSAYDLDYYTGLSNTPNTTLTLDKSTGVSGDTLHLTIKLNSVDASYGGAGFVLVSDLDGQENISFGTIVK